MSKKHIKSIITEMILSECKCTDCKLFDSFNENSICKKCDNNSNIKPKAYITEHIKEKTNEIVAAFNLR